MSVIHNVSEESDTSTQTLDSEPSLQVSRQNMLLSYCSSTTISIYSAMTQLFGFMAVKLTQGSSWDARIV